MKTLIKSLVIMVLINSVSCDKDNEDLNSLIDKGLNGKWNLISVSCECEPVNLVKGQQIWFIDTFKNKLTVENYVTEDLHTIFESGEYSISINHPDSEIEILSTDYSFWFNYEDLFLGDRPEVDGPLIKFVRD